MRSANGTEIPVKVCGIPAIARVDSYHPGSPPILTGHPDRCCPGEPDEVEFTICDRRGRPAEWLERKMTDADRDDAEQQVRAYSPDDGY